MNSFIRISFHSCFPPLSSANQFIYPSFSSIHPLSSYIHSSFILIHLYIHPLFFLIYSSIHYYSCAFPDDQVHAHPWLSALGDITVCHDVLLHVPRCRSHGHDRLDDLWPKTSDLQPLTSFYLIVHRGYQWDHCQERTVELNVLFFKAEVHFMGWGPQCIIYIVHC